MQCYQDISTWGFWAAFVPIQAKHTMNFVELLKHQNVADRTGMIQPNWGTSINFLVLLHLSRLRWLRWSAFHKDDGHQFRPRYKRPDDAYAPALQSNHTLNNISGYHNGEADYVYPTVLFIGWEFHLTEAAWRQNVNRWRRLQPLARHNYAILELCVRLSRFRHWHELLCHARKWTNLTWIQIVDFSIPD